jgi:diguanylate cyclase (GGDEF)-like protein
MTQGEIMQRTPGSDVAPLDAQALQQRVRDLEAQLQSQARELRALEKIEGLQERTQALETENRTLRGRLTELHTFLSLSKSLAATLDLEELFRLALHLIGRALRVDAYALWLLEESGEHLGVKAAFGLPAEGRLRRGEGLAGLVAQTGQALLVPEVSTEPGGPEPRRGACLAVPLRRPGRELLGVLTAHHPEPHGFTLADLDLGQAVANQVAAALENAQLYQRTKELSTRDDLTGLFNRRHFFDQLEKEVQRARRYRRVFSLLLLDLDEFKGYNDTHGHLQGDEALKEVARLLLASTRRADIVARFGGEEFVVLLPEISARGAAVVAEKIRTSVAGYPFAGRATQPGGQLTATLGLATYPTDSEDGLALVDCADRAMYLGKQQGGNRVCPSPGPAPAS